MRKADYDTSVFINCPFDAAYEPILHAVLFTIEYCGFQARCSLERADGGRARIEQLLDIIAECRLGLHDISRTGPNPADLPRFNMPFELGVFSGPPGSARPSRSGRSR